MKMTDYEDYENNLAFPPTTDRTQSKDELVEKIEKLSKQLDIAVKGIQYYANEDIYDRHHQVVNGNNEWESEVMLDCGVKADYALKKIKELDE